MKCILSFCLLFLVFSPCAWSQMKQPIPDYFSRAQSVCVARVAAVHGRQVTFNVTETLRGTPGDILRLMDCTVNAGFRSRFKKDSEWLLVSSGPSNVSDQDTFGWPKLGDYGWRQTPIVRSGFEIYVQDYSYEDGENVRDKGPDGITGLTRGHILRLLQEHPYQL
jgi:hypothetical protein